MSNGQSDHSWELIAKSMLLLLALAIVAGFAFWQGTKYCHVGPQPWPTPAPDADFWYPAPAQVTRCLPTKFCDGIPRYGWSWQINQRGVLRYAPPFWGEGAGESPPVTMPPELLKELQQGSFSEPVPEPVPDSNT